MVALLRYNDTFVKINDAWFFAERLLYVYRAEDGRHLSPEAERGHASRLCGLLRARQRALGAGRGHLLLRCVYWSGVGRGTPQDHSGLYDRVRAGSLGQQPGGGVLF